MIRVAIVDDDKQLIQALKRELLEFVDIENVFTHNSGLGFLKELQEMILIKRPEVVIMDISMSFPDEGIQVTRKIKELFPGIYVIMFTISDTDELIFEAFKAGAVGYLLKNEKPFYILKAILDVYNGGAQMSPSIARKTISLLKPAYEESIAKVQQKKSSDKEPLSKRELEILNLVERGHTYEYIASFLFVSANTVKKHMMNIFLKLQVHNKIEAIKKMKEIQE